jgi:hypothetical protein
MEQPPVFLAETGEKNKVSEKKTQIPFGLLISNAHHHH